MAKPTFNIDEPEVDLPPIGRTRAQAVEPVVPVQATPDTEEESKEPRNLERKLASQKPRNLDSLKTKNLAAIYEAIGPRRAEPDDDLEQVNTNLPKYVVAAIKMQAGLEHYTLQKMYVKILLGEEEINQDLLEICRASALAGKL